MSEPPVRCLPEADTVEQIVETVQQAGAGAAPFALVLGSGFSHGLVPTARELVERSLPLWMKSLQGGDTFENLGKAPDDTRNAIARDFWRAFAAKNAKRGLSLPLDPSTGFPQDYSAAYRAAFAPDYSAAVGEPAQARTFQRALMRLDQPRLNAAHFLLASLLGVQPGKTRRNDLFKTRAAFSRLILTTNFDPFLQTALQAVNRLYFMSDTPELGVGDEILDDQIDAIHLVYLHGSIHRRSQAATDEDIQALKERNARTLAPVLKRHGVIVLGYSGWDDAIVEALAACDRFDHRLYWCGREPDPRAPGAFGPRVPDILRKPSAVYVNIRTAGHFMAQLHTQLVHGLPRLLHNPIGQLREMLQTIDLNELEPMTASAGSAGLLPSDSSCHDVFVRAQRVAIERLSGAEKSFLDPVPDRAAMSSGATSQISQLHSSAGVAAALGNYDESIRLYTQALDLALVPVDQKAGLLNDRGLAFFFSAKVDPAVEDWTRAAELEGAPVEQVAKALYNRAVAWGRKGETAKELADYTRLIEHVPGAPVEHLAKALYNRAVTLSDTGETDRALADYTRIIEQMPGVPLQQVAKALAGRGWAYYERRDYAAFLRDTGAAIGKEPSLDFAAFGLGLALLSCGRDADALVAYRHAAERFPQGIEQHGLSDLKDALETWLTADRAQPVITLLESFLPKSDKASVWTAKQA